LGFQILPLLIALGAAVAGVLGDTRYKDRIGWRRLTPIGWIVLSFAVGSFGTSAYQARKASQVIAEQAKKDDILRNIAREDLFDSINVLLAPFKSVIDASQSETVDSASSAINAAFYSPVDRLDIIGSEQFLTKLDKLGALDCPGSQQQQDRCSWAFLIQSAAYQSDDLLKNVATRYAGVLPSSVINTIQSVRSDKMLSIMKSTFGNIKMTRNAGNNVQNISVGYLLRGPHQPSDYYLPFFEQLKTIVKTTPQ
jgi:hypothetical protein